MTLAQLQQFNGAAVHIRIDGAEALGILFFGKDEEIYITSLCFLEAGRECPLIRRVLSPEEWRGITRRSHNQLQSRIEIVTEGGADAPPAELEAAEKEKRALMERVLRADDQSGKVHAEFGRLQTEASETLAKMRSLRAEASGRRKPAREAPAPPEAGEGQGPPA